jgi:hypothetical protein
VDERTGGGVVLNGPRRFDVSFSVIDGPQSTYEVVTWFGRHVVVSASLAATCRGRPRDKCGTKGPADSPLKREGSSDLRLYL